MGTKYPFRDECGNEEEEDDELRNGAINKEIEDVEEYDERRDVVGDEGVDGILEGVGRRDDKVDGDREVKEDEKEETGGKNGVADEREEEIW